MGDFIALCQWVAERSSAVWASLVAYLRLDAEALYRQAESVTPRERVQHSASLAASTFIVLLVAGWLLFGETLPPIGVIGRQLALAVGASCLIAAPLWLALRWGARRRGLFFLINLMLLQALFFSLVAAASNIVLVSTEPARTEFSMLRNGIGYDTLASRFLCGGVELERELILLSIRTEERTKVLVRDSDAILKDIRRIQSWPDPRELTLEQKLPIMREISAQIERREAELSRREVEMLTGQQDLQRRSALLSERSQVERDFYRRYGTVKAAVVVAIGGLFIIIVWTSLNIWKAAVWPAKRWKGKVIAIGALLVAWIGSGLLIGTGIHLATPAQPHFDLPEIGPIASVQDAEEASRRLSELDAVLEDDLTTLVHRYENRRHQLRGLCPTLNKLPSRQSQS